VYACGPNPMLRAVSERCAELEIPVQVAVEEQMACGTGICFTCVLPLRTKDGEVKMKRSCLDGPVFNGARIAWDHSRYQLGTPLEVEDEEEDEPAPKLTEADLWGEA
jgi:dihydroorotate dehydrogenase electron transfer subunit